MNNVYINDIVKITRGQLLCGNPEEEITDLCINSQEIKEGDLFIPLIGEKVDAHRFIEDSLKIGSATLTSETLGFTTNKAVIQVEDTLVALQDIGKWLRSRVDVDVVAITGSVGKTTTREMITATLATKLNVFHTLGNYNSVIGVPITMSRLSPGYDVAVLESGTSEIGEIKTIVDIIKPKVAVVTCIGVCHIEQFKTQEAIREEKLDIARKLPADGTLFLNGDDEMLRGVNEDFGCKVVYYGENTDCDVRVENIRSDDGKTFFDYVDNQERIPVELSVMGRHNIQNALVSIAVAKCYGVNGKTAAEGLKSFSGLRQKFYKLDKYTILDDSYNASPDSMKASLNVLCEYKSLGRKIALLGDMLELGENGVKYHYQVGEYIANSKLDELIVIGDLAQNIALAVEDNNRNIKVTRMSDCSSAAQYLENTMKKDDIVLLKASNSMNFKSIVQSINK